MPHDGAIIFGDLIGKLDVLRIECARRGLQMAAKPPCLSIVSTKYEL